MEKAGWEETPGAFHMKRLGEDALDEAGKWGLRRKGQASEWLAGSHR